MGWPGHPRPPLKTATARNDSLLNSYNPVQLSAWRANVDMQYVVSRNKVLQYVAKYATKSEPRSKALRAVYDSIMQSLDDSGTSLQMVHKLLINSVGVRDYSAQETCHLLLQLPMFRASRDFVILSLDGSRELRDRLNENRAVTLASQLDHYCARPLKHSHYCTLCRGTRSLRELGMKSYVGGRKQL